MYSMKQCLICLEETNKLFKNANCKCKYNVHKSCLNKWSNHSCRCIICKAPIINNPKNIWIFDRAIDYIVAPLLQLLFVPILAIYVLSMNIVYLLNVYVLESYDNIGR